jgi:hypothetical protein
MKSAAPALTLALAVALAVGSACTHERPALTTTTGATIVTIDDAVNELTSQRCQRAVDCKQVGTGKKYEDLGACERQLDHDLRTPLRPATCTYGVREEKLEECLEEIRTQQCSSPRATLDTKMCRAGRLCIR